MDTASLAGRARALLAPIIAGLARWKVPLRIAFVAAMAGLVAWQLWSIGLAALAAQIPTNPLFYIIYWAGFAVLPASEMLIYRTIWPSAPRAPFLALLRKRVLNNVVLGYSGDVWFLLWARTRLGVPDRRLLAGLKDSSLLSGAASSAITAAIALAFILTGHGEGMARAMGARTVDVWIGLAALAVLVALALRFGHRILWIGGRAAARVFAIHVGRIGLVQLAQVLQWMVALPLVPFETWLMFLTVQMLVNQLPFVPNRDLLFLALGVELTALVGTDEAGLAAMLVSATLLKQATNYSALALTMLLRDSAATAPRGAPGVER